MRTPLGALIIVACMLSLDTYVFAAIRTLSLSATPKARNIIFTAYWTVSVLAVLGFLLFVFTGPDFMPKKVRTYLFATVIGLFLGKLVASAFFLLDDLRRGIQWLAGRLFIQGTGANDVGHGNISRSAFLSWVGITAGTGLFGSLLYGFGNKYRYTVKKLSLSSARLPEAFKGLKIVHISDIHSGSFTDKRAVEKGVELILQQKPDLILFTGDLVNNLASEMDEYQDVFARLKAPMGVYSTLGNHDYADYVKWDSADAKAQNLLKLKQVHAAMGWRLLKDEHVRLERNGEQIALIGVQNISGRSSFHSYGSMEKAYQGVNPEHFQILMSHDPSHWDSEVRPLYPMVDLTLSGHTHGMQFGLELPGFRWSPVQYMYKQWAGLYEEGHQRLYINRGFGFIGYPGRLGILPEITVIELG
jgi:uncharacterized protein